MKRFFDAELETFRSQLILMGETAIEQVRTAVKALIEANPGLANQVIAADDKLDRLEVEIDDEAVRYMNLRAPIASELRLVIVGMKASHDLERVGTSDEHRQARDQTQRRAPAQTLHRLAPDSHHGPGDAPRRARLLSPGR